MCKKSFILTALVLLAAMLMSPTQTFGELLQNNSLEDYNEGQWGYDPGWPYNWGAWGALWSWGWYGDGWPDYEYDDANYPAFEGRACARMTGTEYATWEQRLDLDSDWVEDETYYWGFWVRDMREGGSPDAISPSVFYFKDGNEYDGTNLTPNLRFFNEQWVPADGQYHYIETDFNIPSGYDIDEIKLLFFKMQNGEYIADYAYIGDEPRPAPRFALNPVPFDSSAQDLSVSTLSWTNAEPQDPNDTVTVDVYFLDAGTERLSVAPDLGLDVVDPLAIQLADDEAISSVALPSAVELGHHYYWAVHTKDPNSGGTEVTIPAIKSWYFYIDYHVPIDDFDSYDRYIDPIDDTWLEDGRAMLTLQTDEADANYVRDGNSMEYNYRNNFSPYYSEATRIFSPSMDWTENELKSFSLWFHGGPDNAPEQLYLRITDGNSPRGEVTIVYEDSNDLIQEPEDSWHEWNIVLSDLSSAVDLTDVNGITIGFGDGVPAGGSGYVYFEDIRLYPRRCVRAHSYGFGDITGDCSVDYKDVEIMAQDWLIYDYNTFGYPGTLKGFDDPDGSWSTGVDNGSLYFPGIDDVNGDLICGDSTDPIPGYSSEYPGYVEIPAFGIKTNTITMTAWIKTYGLQCDWSTGIVFMRPPATGINLFEDQLCYHWNNAHWSWRSSLFVPLDTWTFVALVVSPGGATLYVDGEAAYDTTGSWPEVEFAEPMWLGKDFEDNRQARYFKGWIDDVRVYDFSLDASEIEHVRTFGGSGTEPASSPFSWFKLDETSGTSTADSSGKIVYWPITSKANIEDPEPQYHKAVNFRDYCIVADHWLGQFLFPPE